MTQNSTQPEDGQPKRTDNADQHLSSGPGQETQAAAPGREQEAGCPASSTGMDEERAVTSCPCTAAHAGPDSQAESQPGATQGTVHEQAHMHAPGSHPGRPAADEAAPGNAPLSGFQPA